MHKFGEKSLGLALNAHAKRFEMIQIPKILSHKTHSAMKSSLIATLFVSLLALGMTACKSGTTPAADPTTPPVAAAAGAADLGHEGTYVDYSDDWGAFKSAVINKNIDGMKMYIKGDTDPQNLLDMMDADAVADMENTTYKQLKDTDYNGIKVKEWSYEVSGVDEEGNEVGSGLFYYFEEQKEGLRLIGILAAG